MTSQHRSLGFPRHTVTTSHRAGQVLAGLIVVAMGFMIFRAILAAADDTMLAMLGLVLLFLMVASLLAGDRRRRL
ncbi:hypothetical protein [Novosphingobium terrae]|uniref:hypothetical protein n=1 Tax=Novosphingobium terrae TaxID=2726189 RepID=UPI00197E6193|nr:hypothetical protein [Novosphingobium terrae]